jgi:hypothetical protein
MASSVCKAGVLFPASGISANLQAQQQHGRGVTSSQIPFRAPKVSMMLYIIVHIIPVPDPFPKGVDSLQFYLFDVRSLIFIVLKHIKALLLRSINNMGW